MSQAVETELMGWSSPMQDIRLAIVWVSGGEPIIQLRETWSYPGAPTPEPFPATEAGYAEARAIARLRAQIIKQEQEA
jgi:hypothetical protein